MSAALPSFQRGEILTADKLNALILRARALQARQAGGGTFIHRALCVPQCRHYAFELAELSGVLYYRQGWVDPGTGEPIPVGEKEWNHLGRLQPCTIWLEISGGNPTDCTAEVVQGEYDESTPETNFRRRLGYVREQKAETEGGSSLLYCVQVLGGLITPCAPRRTMGSPSFAEPEKFCKCDYTGWDYRCAGILYGGGFEVPGVAETYRAEVSFGYAVEIDGDDLSTARGGYRMKQGIIFGNVWSKIP